MSNEQLTLTASRVACDTIGCNACAGGDLKCPTVNAYRQKYGDAVNLEAGDDLGVWFPRAWDGIEVEVVEAEGADAVHDRLAAGGYAEGRKRELEKERRRRGWWVK